MKIPDKQEIHQIAINHSLDIGFEDFISLHKKCTSKPYSFVFNIVFYVLDVIFLKEYKK